MEIPLHKLPAHGLFPVTLPDGSDVVIAVSPGGIAVFADECPHQGLPVSAGSLGADGTITCPFHGAQFSASTGACVCGPATDALPRFASTIVEGSLRIGPRLAPG